MQSKTASPFFTRELPEQKAVAATQVKKDGIASGIEAFAKRINEITNQAGVMDRLSGMRSTMHRVLGAVRSVTGMTGGVSDLIVFPRAFVADLAGGLSGLVDLRGFGGVGNFGWKSIKGLFNDVVRLPTSSSKGEMPASFKPSTTGVVTVQEAQQPIEILPADLAILDAVVKLAVAGELIDVAADILTDDAQTPTLSPPELEQIVNDVRDAVQEAIDVHRDLYPLEESRPVTEPLKSAALAIQEAAISIIDAHPPLMRRTLEAAGNLHLIAFRWYGDYRRAEELKRLNPDLRNPNDLQAGDTINAYQR